MSASLPALQPPAGLQSNFEDPHSRISLTVIPCAAIVGFMIIFVFMRMYTKVYILKSVGWDDYTCMFAAVCQMYIRNREQNSCSVSDILGHLPRLLDGIIRVWLWRSSMGHHSRVSNGSYVKGGKMSLRTVGTNHVLHEAFTLTPLLPDICTGPCHQIPCFLRHLLLLHLVYVFFAAHLPAMPISTHAFMPTSMGHVPSYDEWPQRC